MNLPLYEVISTVQTSFAPELDVSLSGQEPLDSPLYMATLFLLDERIFSLLNHLTEASLNGSLRWSERLVECGYVNYEGSAGDIRGFNVKIYLRYSSVGVCCENIMCNFRNQAELSFV